MTYEFDEVDWQGLASSISSLSGSYSVGVSNEDLARTATELSHARLKTYTGHGAGDDTTKILTAFLDHLPLHGKRLMHHFVQSGTTDEELRKLAYHLKTAILIPGESLGPLPSCLPLSCLHSLASVQLNVHLLNSHSESRMGDMGEP